MSEVAVAQQQPVGGVTPATGISAGCGCPNVIADEVNYPSGNYLLASCQPYAGQLPGYSALTPAAPASTPAAPVGYQSVYDPLATVVQPSEAVSTAAPAPVEAAEEANKAALVREFDRMNLRDRMNLINRSQPPRTTAPARVAEPSNVVNNVSDTVKNTLDNVRRRFGFRRLGGAAAQLGPITVPTSVEEVTQPFARLAENLGLTSQKTPGAEVQLGPVSLPTTLDELKQSVDSLRQNVTGGVGYRADPRLPRRRAIGAQVGQSNTARNVLLVLLGLAIVAGVVAGFLWNRKNLKGKLSALRQDMMRRQ